MKRSTFILVSGTWILVSQISSAIVDSNNNGLSDLWEKHFNTGNLLTDPNPLPDPDGDGWTNAQEAAAGTHPFDPNPPGGYLQPDFLHVPETWSDWDDDEILEHTPEAVVLTWETIPGKQYTLLTSPDLTAESWSAVGAPMIGNGNIIENGFPITDSQNPRPDKLFWRVAVTESGLDSDSDGLSNYEEFLAGTDPVISDSDGDALSDYTEILAGTNPFNPDEDGDGLTDPFELTAGTGSNNQDSDGDGIPDSIDGSPLVSAQDFPDADGDGIPDSEDPEPNNPRGPAPSLTSDNASGNPLANLATGLASSFILTVSNPAGPASDPSDLTLFLNGTEEAATITTLSSPSGTQRFLLNWTAKITTGYPDQTLQNISLRFRDSESATTWLNLARIDVAEWEGMIAGMSLSGLNSGNGFAVEVKSHQWGVKQTAQDLTGARAIWYRGPKTIPLLNPSGSGTGVTAQIGAKRYPLFMIAKSGSLYAVEKTLDISDPTAFPHHGWFYVNRTSAPITMSPFTVGSVQVPSGETAFQPFPVAPEAGGPNIGVMGTTTISGQTHTIYSAVWELKTDSLKWRYFPGLEFQNDPYATNSVSVLTDGLSGLDAGIGATITPHSAGTLEYPGLPISPPHFPPAPYIAVPEWTPLLPIQSELWHKLVLNVGLDAGALSNGITLKLGTSEEGENAPQSGFSLLVPTSSGFSPLTIPADGKIEMLPSSELYQKLTSLEGLTLFLKRGPTVSEFHRLGLDLIPKRSSYPVQRIAALDLPPIDIVDKSGVILTELKVGKMYPDVLTGNGLNGDPVNANLDKDDDRFFVRVKVPNSFGTIKMKFETINNAEAMYNDDPTEYTLKAKDGYLTTKSMVLVSDDVDDNHLLSTGGDLDNSLDDRTHLVQLGGNFKISAIKAGMGNWVPIDIKLQVKKKKTVRVQFVNCTYGFFVTGPCWDPSLIAWVQRKMRQRYAQVGVDFDFPTVLAGPWVSNTGSMADGEIFSLPSGTGKIVFPQESKDLVDHGPPNDFNNTLMIYLVRGMDSYRGAATPPKYVNAVDVRFQNKVFLAQFDFKDFTAAHEALHVLSDAAHDVAPYFDFDTEYANMHTIWTLPSEAQAERRNNGSVGSTKRISLAQEVKIQSLTLAK